MCPLRLLGSQAPLVFYSLSHASKDHLKSENPCPNKRLQTIVNYHSALKKNSSTKPLIGVICRISSRHLPLPVGEPKPEHVTISAWQIDISGVL